MLNAMFVSPHVLILMSRFCGKDYHPFDASDINKYVVTDDYTPIWDIPSMNKYFSKGFTAKQTLQQYLLDEGRQPFGIFKDIESTIRDVYLTKLSKLRESLKPYHHRYSFTTAFYYVNYMFVLCCWYFISTKLYMAYRPV